MTSKRRRVFTKDQKLEMLRPFGRKAGVLWLRDVLRAGRVKTLSDLPEETIDVMLACYAHTEQAAAGAV